MNGKEFKLVFEKIKESLKNKSEVSLPELQAKFGISYPEARLAIMRLKDELMIIGDPEGMKYTVNPEILEKRALSEAEAAYFRSRLSDDEVARLRALSALEKPKPESLGKYKRLIELELVYFRAGRLYYAIDAPSVSLIASFSTNSEEWFEIISAMEIAYAMKKYGAEFKPRELTVIPASIQEKITGFLSLTSLDMPDCETKYSMGKFVLIESFILKNILPDIDSYREKIKKELLALEGIGLTSGVLVSTVRECAEEFSDLTYDNIEEIRKMLAD